MSSLPALIILFLFGTFIGSFLNVLILRHNTGKTLLGRSGCMSCRGQLRWFELVPVLSWVIQRGRCLRCASRVSLQYPLVEIVAGLSFALAYFISTTIPEFVFNVALLLTLLVIFVYDLKHKIIPDLYVWIFLGLGVVAMFVDFETLGFVRPSLSQVVAPFTTALPFVTLWLISRGRWIGFGDAKLALGMGAFLGIKGGLIAVLYGFWSGAAMSISIIAAQKLLTLSRSRKQLTMKSEVPFAPF